MQLVWFVTLMATILLDVDYGLIIGFCAVAVAIIARSVLSHSHLLGTVRHETNIDLKIKDTSIKSTLFVEKTIYPAVCITIIILDSCFNIK